MINKNVPEIRFPEFTDDWEQRKLNKLAKFSKGKGYTKNDLKSNGKEIILYGRLYTKYETEIIDIDTFVESDAGAVKSEQGDVIVPASGETSKDISRASVVVKEGIILGGDLNIIKTKKEELSPVFLSLTISNGSQQKELIKRAQGKSVVHLHNSDLEKVSVNMPSIEEQQKIGAFFKTLDDTIALHQHKLNILKQTKQGSLQKMFPKEGESVPELRFPGFTDDWELRKLGDIGSVAMCKRIFKEETSDSDEVPFYKIGTFGGEPDAYISRELFEEYKSKYPYPENGDLLISASGSIGRIVEYKGKDEYFQDSNIVWLKHDNKIINSFLKQFYGVVKWKGLEGSTIKRLYNKNILETEIMIPSTDEQIKIGDFFKQLDQTIALHQRELDLLKETKKGFLQKLFV